MKCVKDCPGCAIPDKGELPTVKIHIDGREYEWGDVHMGRCTATHHGINYKASPFLKRFLPGFNLDITKTTMSEETAYKIGYTLAGGDWGRENPEYPGRCVIPYYRQILAHTGYFAVCGAKGCIRSCMEFQEKTKNIGQNSFHTPVFPGKKWEPSGPPESDQTGASSRKRSSASSTRRRMPTPAAGSKPPSPKRKEGPEGEEMPLRLPRRSGRNKTRF